MIRWWCGKSSQVVERFWPYFGGPAGVGGFSIVACSGGSDPGRFTLLKEIEWFSFENPGSRVEVVGPKRAGFVGLLETIFPLLFHPATFRRTVMNQLTVGAPRSLPSFVQTAFTAMVGALCSASGLV